MSRSTLLRGAMLYGARVTYGILLLAASIVVARLYGPYGLGVYSLFLALTNMGGIVGVMGLNTVLIERLPELRLAHGAGQQGAVASYLRSLLLIITLTGTVATVVTLVLARLVVPELAWSAVTVLFISWSTLFLSLLVSQHRQVVAATLESVMRPAVYVIILLVLGGHMAQGFRLSVNVALISSLFFLVLLSGFFYLRAMAHARAITGPRPRVGLRHVRHGAVYMVIALMTAAAQQIDRFVLESLASTEAVGIYSSAQNIMNIVIYALLALMSLLLPAIAEWQAGSLDQETFVKRCVLVSRALTVLALGVAGVCLLAGQHLLSIFGPSFAAGQQALIVLALGQVVAAAVGVSTTVLSIGRHRMSALWITSMSVCVSVGLSFAFIPFWGITGAAAANAIALVANRVVGHEILRRRTGLVLSAWRKV